MLYEQANMQLLNEHRSCSGAGMSCKQNLEANMKQKLTRLAKHPFPSPSLQPSGLNTGQYALYTIGPYGSVVYEASPGC
jgi:hypothetical protein